MTDMIPKVGTWSKAIIEEYEDPNTGEMLKRVKWTRGKFGDEERRIICEELAKHGRTGTACRAAGVSHTTFLKYCKKDPDFAEVVAQAVEAYKDKVIAHHQNLVFDGTEKETFDRQGNLVSREKIYPIPLIQMELRKVDDSYRDKKEVDLNYRGGVMVAPPTVSVEEWESKYGKKRSGDDVEDAVVIPPDAITDLPEGDSGESED